MLRATHLAKVKSEVYERSWERFFVQRPARLVAVRPCLTGISMRSAEIVDISRGGASFVVATTVGLPSHYYLNILGLAYRIACAETSRNGNRIVLLGVKGDRFECLFGNDQKPVPELISVETTAPDKSVTVLTGKTLGKLNALIAQQLSVLSKPPMITKD